MRLFISIICPSILSSVLLMDIDLAPKFVGNEEELMLLTEQKTQSFAIFPKRKKKRLKNSNKVKKHNRSMGTKFKRKNDDTLRR